MQLSTRGRKILALAVVCGTASPLYAVNWANTSGGTFNTSANWSGPFPPGTNDDAGFNLNTAGYTVTFDISPTNQRVIVGTDKVTFALAAHTYTLTQSLGGGDSVQLANSPGGAASLTVQNGTIHAVAVEAGIPAGSHGQLNLQTGATFNASGLLSLGGNGAGDVELFAGADMTTGGAELGNQPGSSGVVGLTGSGTTWANTGSINVGSAFLSPAPGSINLTSSSAITTDTLNIGPVGVGSVIIDSSSLTANTGVAVGGTQTAAGAAGSLIINGTAIYSSPLTKVWALGRIAYNSGSFSTGSLVLVGGGQMTLVAGHNRTVRTTSISIDSLSKLELSDNRAIVDYTGASPIASIQSLIRTGYAGGTWFGNGISSVSARFDATKALGYGDNTVLGLTTFYGHSVDSTSVLIKYTYFGDADLDGDADGVDIGTWATNFTGELGGTGTKVWTQGDWDYDGDVDGVDAGKWAQSFTGELGGGGLGSLVIDTPMSPQAAAILRGLGITVVPEPTACALAGLAAGLLRRGRRGTSTRG
ncbi:MAG TPA: hypothetical protein VH518_23465 [Tepidisphaeraceae bacterium]|jgi:hypothetical protein